MIMVFFILCKLIIHGQPTYTIEGHTDTLSLNSVRYFFQITPISLKNGYDTDVWNCREISSLAYMMYVTGYYSPFKPKGYALNWVVRDNLLFIKDIKPRFEGFKLVDTPSGISKMVPPDENDVSGDTLRIRLERFTGSKFRNGHLFVDWITGDFVLFQINEDTPPKIDDWSGNNKVFENEYYLPPILLQVKNGKVLNIRELTTNSQREK